MARKIIQPKTLNDPRPRYSQGIRTSGGKLLFIAGQTASDQGWQGRRQRRYQGSNRAGLRQSQAVLKKAGATIDDLVMTTTYIVDRKYREGYNEVRSRQYKKNPPTSTLVIVKGLAHPDYLIEIAGIAVI